MKTVTSMIPTRSNPNPAESSASPDGHSFSASVGSHSQVRARCGGLSSRGSPLISLIAAAIVGLMAGCTSTTLFQSNFSSNELNAAPAHDQATGTISTAGSPGGVLVVDAPAGANGRWAMITHADPNAPISEMRCKFSAAQGVGTYSLIAAMHIPDGVGAASIEFDTSPNGSPPNLGFFHIDFLKDGTVRMDDDSNQVWGTFSHDKTFALSVTLEITDTGATAHASILGSGTSGSIDYPLRFGNLARHLGAVKFWMGSPWTGSYHVTDIVVTKRNN